VTVLDAYAVVAYLRDEAAAGEVAELLRLPTTLSAVNAAEVIDQLVRVFGRDPDDVHADLAILSQVGMELAPLTPETGTDAGRLRARHYHRQRSAVSLADCVAAATAQSRQRPLATSDPALAAVVRAEGGQVHGLPDSKGRLP
jgi:PIN domain nuclease of toxin-antitoxin system